MLVSLGVYASIVRHLSHPLFFISLVPFLRQTIRFLKYRGAVVSSVKFQKHVGMERLSFHGCSFQYIEDGHML